MQFSLTAHVDGRKREGHDASEPDGREDVSAVVTGDEASASAADESDAPHSAVRVLMQRSRVAQLMKSIPPYRNILVIEDDPRDSDRLASTLRAIFGYDIKLRQCPTLGTALDALFADQPDLVFLDDRMGPVDKAESSVPFLRTAHCTAAIIVVSNYIDRRRRAELLKLSVQEVIDKDDLDGLSICQALIRGHPLKP